MYVSKLSLSLFSLVFLLRRPSPRKWPLCCAPNVVAYKRVGSIIIVIIIIIIIIVIIIIIIIFIIIIIIIIIVVVVVVVIIIIT